MPFDRITAPEGESRFAVNNGVRLHYHIRGVGPPVVLLHGYPEYWNVWCHQIENLCRDYCVITPDLRGFNLSDKPKGIEQYSAPVIAGDLFTVLDDLGFDKVALVGHDIGGMIAWWIASYAPQRVDRLAILSAPHPVEYLTMRRQSPQQHQASRYVDRMLNSNCAPLEPERLAFWLEDDKERSALESAIRRSDVKAMASYYQSNLSPRSPFLSDDVPRVYCPTLLIYGPDDPYIAPEAYDRTSQWIDGLLTTRILAGKGHFLHHSAADAVNAELRHWLGTT